VIAHRRIVVLGDNNPRIHVEIITAGGAIGEGRLIRLNVGEVKSALQRKAEMTLQNARIRLEFVFSS
jgi:hypothetical protein